MVRHRRSFFAGGTFFFTFAGAEHVPSGGRDGNTAAAPVRDRCGRCVARQFALQIREETQMKQQSLKRMLLALATAAISTLLIQPLRAEVIEKTKTVGGTTIHYKTVLPDGYDP